MKSSFSKGLLLALGLSAALVASAVEPAELDAMKGKALRGNVLAQYNLGRYHSDASSGVLDRAEAFAWLKLAAENGTGSMELVKLTEEMSPAELAEGRRRLEERRQQVKTGSEAGVASEAAVATDGLAKLQAERDQLASSLGAATTELAQLRAAQSQNAGAEKLRSEVIKLESELNETRAAARQMAVRNQQLEDTASERGRALAAAKTELEQAKAAVVKPVVTTDSIALNAEKESLQKQLTAAQDELRKAKADGERIERAERDVVVLRAQNEKLSAEQARAQEAVANVTQLTREVERLRSAQAQSPSADELILARERLAAMERQNAELVERARQAETRLVAAASTPAVEAPVVPAGESVAELKAQLADVEMKLATSLRSFTLQQQEFDKSREQTVRAQADVEARLNTAVSDNTALNTQLQNALAELKAREAQLVDTDKEAGLAKQSSLNSSIEATALRDQLRQTQAQMISVIEENSQLKTKLAVIAPQPASSLGTPIRPGTAAAQAAITLPPAIAPSAPTRSAPATRAAPAVSVTVPASVAVPEVRTHIVAEGDSLSRISRKYYGTAERWNEIFEANRNILSNPSKLPAGASLRIP